MARLWYVCISNGGRCMKRFTFILLVVCSSIVQGIGERSAHAQQYREDPERGGAARAKAYFSRLDAPFENGLSREFLDRAWSEIQALPSELDAGSSPGIGWQCIGPFGYNGNYLANGPTRWTGRVLDLEMQPGGALRFAAASGGLWEALWGANSLSDGITSLTIGSFATLPSNRNTIIVGTGEDATSLAGTGIWKTTDGGGSWVHLPVPDISYVYKVRFDPVVAGYVHAATNLGYYLSTDNGETWTRTFDGKVWDFAFAYNGPLRLIYLIANNHGVWRSLDDGHNFPERVAELPQSGHSRGSISAVRPPGSDYSTVYVALSNATTLVGIFKSDNAGYGWSTVTPPSPVEGSHQTTYNHALGVCPTDPNIVLAGWVKLYRTSNGGQTWSKIDDLDSSNHDRTHDDWHEILWTGGSGVYGSNDGGIFYSSDFGFTWGAAFAYNVAPITQFYNFDVGESDPRVIYGGTQDNGIIGTTSGGTQWLGTSSGDGAGTTIDPYDASRVYSVIGSSPPPRQGVRYRSANYGLSWTQIGPALMPGTVIRNDRFPPVHLYTDNTSQVMTSNDQGSTWTALNATPFGNPISNITVGLFSSGGSGAAVYAVLEGGGLFVYDQGTWYNRKPGLPSGYYIQKVATHSRQHNVAYALMQGVWPLLAGNKVFKTTNRGQTWTNVTGNLPNIPVTDLVPHPTDPNRLYLGSKMGCYRTSNGGASWVRWNYGMPEANIVTEMKFIDSLAINGKFYVVAATYGRSIWQRDISTEDPLTSRVSRCCLNIPITDNTTVRDTMHFNLPPGGGTVLRATVSLDSVLHTFDGSLILTLLHNGVRDTIVRNSGGEGHHFIATTFDDDAILSLADGLPPFTGVFRPYQPLAQFDGLPAGGDWILEIHDGQPGHTGELRGWSLTIAFGAPTVSFDVLEGWNLISVPLAVSDYSKNTLFPGSSSDAFAYQDGYLPQSVLSNGAGYWLKFPTFAQVNLSGVPIESDTIPVVRGWNLIGSISQSLQVAAIQSVPAGLTTSPFFGFGNSGYVSSPTLEPGKGYWVKCASPGSLILSSVSFDPGMSINIQPTAEQPPPPPVWNVGTEAELPVAFSLDQNYPNPFNPVTTITFAIPTRAGPERTFPARTPGAGAFATSLQVFDLLGRRVATLVNDEHEPGIYSVSFNASYLSSGTYIYRLTAGDYTATKRMMLLK